MPYQNKGKKIYKRKKKGGGREAKISSCYHFNMRIWVTSATSIMGGNSLNQ